MMIILLRHTLCCLIYPLRRSDIVKLIIFQMNDCTLLIFNIYIFRARAVGIHGDKSQSERDHVLKRKFLPHLFDIKT